MIPQYCSYGSTGVSAVPATILMSSLMDYYYLDSLTLVILSYFTWSVKDTHLAKLCLKTGPSVVLLVVSFITTVLNYLSVV